MPQPQSRRPTQRKPGHKGKKCFRNTALIYGERKKPLNLTTTPTAQDWWEQLALGEHCSLSEAFERVARGTLRTAKVVRLVSADIVSAVIDQTIPDVPQDDSRPVSEGDSKLAFVALYLAVSEALYLAVRLMSEVDLAATCQNLPANDVPMSFLNIYPGFLHLTSRALMLQSTP